MILLFAMEYMTLLGMLMVMMFLDRKYSQRTTVAVVCCAIVLVMAAVAGIFFIAGISTTVKIYSLIAHVPSLLLFFALSRFRGWRLLFQILSAILFCTLIQHMAALAYYLSGNRVWVLLLAYVVLSAGTILFLTRFLRPLFLQTLQELHKGGWLICAIMAMYYALTIYLIPGYVGEDRTATFFKPAVSLLMVGFYSVLVFLFSSLKNETENRRRAELATLQLSAFKKRMEAVKVAELSIRTERHDLRHRLQTVAELVANGNRDEALSFLDAAQKRLDKQKEIRWCRPPILDAVFSSYFDQARSQEIIIDAKISLPDSLSVEEGELAIVVANALENAIHANLELPFDKRQIHVKMVGTPSVMLEISNPCADDIVFDSSGLPVVQEEGHGLGVQSISAFCQKNGAVCQFDLTDGCFRFRLIL